MPGGELPRRMCQDNMRSIFSLPQKLRAQSICLAVIVLVALLSLLKLHGFSVPLWHEHIDDSPQTEVILGQAQGIRSDDFVAVIPQILSQRAHNPSFPVYNTLIGDGHCNMRLNYAMPIRDWTLLFHPQVWGYLWGSDFGLAWNWWVLLGGVWLVLFLLIRLVTNNNIGMALGGATLLVYSPFFQYWSLNCAPSVMFAGLSLIFADSLFRGQGTFRLVGSGLGLIWALTAFLLTFSFLPYFITLFYLVLFCFVGLRGAAPRTSDGSRFQPPLLLAFAGLTVILLAILFVFQNWESIRIAAGSSYPGKRFASGGEGTWADLLRGSFLTWAHPFKWHALGNICGASSFCLFFPLTSVLVFFFWRRYGQRPNGIQLALLACLILFLIWYLVGLPESIAKYTRLNRVPERRTLLVIGICDVLLFCSVLRQHLASPFARLIRDPILGWALGGFAVFLIVEGYVLKQMLPSYSIGKMMGAGSFTFFLGCLFIYLPRGFIPVFAMASVCSTLTFNPLVRGGTVFIAENSLSQAISTINRGAVEKGIQPQWVAYGSKRYDIYLSNLFRMLGVRSVDGVHPYPQPGLWILLDPHRSFEEVWNRYAHVRFELPAEPGAFSIDLVQHDLIVVRLQPGNPLFSKLGITHVLVTGDPHPYTVLPGLRLVWAAAPNYIFEVQSAAGQ